MKTTKLPLAHIFEMITSNTELTEQDLMQMTLEEIEDLKECVSASLRIKFELEQKIKKFNLTKN